MTAQEAQIKAQQQQNPAAMMMQQQQQRMNMKGAAILQLNSFAESLSYISVCQFHFFLLAHCVHLAEY